MKSGYCNRNRGFTLVEMMVVLTIIAILAAVVSPSVLGYIDDAKNKECIIHARTAVTAAQTELSTLYSAGKLKLTAEEKRKWKAHYEFSDEVSLSVETITDKDHITKGREKNAYTINRAFYRENGLCVEYVGEDYHVVELVDGYELPIVFMGTDDNASADSILMNR